jgi:hypothetical protein
VQDEAQTRSGAGTDGQRYLFRPVCGSAAIRLSPPENKAAMKPAGRLTGGTGSRRDRPGPPSVSDRSVALMHPAFLPGRGFGAPGWAACLGG